MYQITDEWNPNPGEHWTLVDWFNAAGVKSDAQIANEASRLGVGKEDQIWEPKRINETKHRVSGIIKRELALDYIKVLASIAKQGGINLFTAQRFEEDARIFLSSKACREAYAAPTNTELVEFFQQTSPQDDIWSQNLSILRNRVQPTPPLRLFGRKNDLQTIREKLDKYPVAIIDGIAGEGKTALAWFTASKLCEEHRFTNFDWVTDKRSVVDVHGNELPIHIREDNDRFFERLLISVCRQFKWLDILGATGDHLINRCADRLRQGRYLIVVDNLESVKNSEAIVRQLSDILSPKYSGEPLSSRALVTSRKQVNQGDIGTISIDGIETDECIQYIEHLEDVSSIEPRLSYVACQHLVQATGGNPLFIQIALRRYALQPSPTSWEWIISDVADGKHKAFDTLFKPLIEQLGTSSNSIEFASIIAIELSSTTQPLDVVDLWGLWQSVLMNENRNDFSEVLNHLVSNRIISWHGQFCSMHALIRSFLVRMSDSV